MASQFGATAGGGGGAPPSGARLVASLFHGNQQLPQRPLYAPDPRSAGLTASAAAAAPPFGGHVAVHPFHGIHQPPQRPPIPDPPSAGLTADAARELKKARIREEVLAREAEEHRLLEQEVRRELQFERAMAERRREVQRLGLILPMPGPPAYRVAEPSVADSVPPLPPNGGPYLVPCTPQAWGRERQGPVQLPPGNLERPESVEVPRSSGETHPLHIDYKPEDSVGKRSGSVSVPAENNVSTCSLPIAHGVGGEKPGSVHHSDNQGPLLPISHCLESTAGEHPGSGQAPDQPDLLSGKRSALPNGYCPENVVGERPGLIHQSDDRTLLPKADHPEANIGESLLSSSLHQDYEFFTRLETELLGHHQEVGVSGGPPLVAHPVGVNGQSIRPPSNSDIGASKPGKDCSGKEKKLVAHPAGVDGQPIRPPSNSDIGASKPGKDCSGKEKKKRARVKKSAKEAPIEGGAQKNCHLCGQSGHISSNCRALENEAEKLDNCSCITVGDMVGKGYAHAPSPSNDVCDGCGNIGHQKTSCPFLKNEAKVVNKKRKLQAVAEGSAGIDGICLKSGGSGHHQDCLPVHKQDTTYLRFEGICFRCGGSGHRLKDCLVLPEEGAPLHPFEGKKGRCFHCGGMEHRVNDCLIFLEKVEANKKSLQKQNAKKNTYLEDNKKNKRKCLGCGETGHLLKDCPVKEQSTNKEEDQDRLDEDK